MKKIKICMSSCLSVFILTSCELNIVPDSISTIEDRAFVLRKEAGKVLFICCRYMPSDGSLRNNVTLLGAGDSCISDVFRNYLGTSTWHIAQGLQESDSPYCTQWGHLYEGITYCNILIENIHAIPNMDDSGKNRWIGEMGLLEVHYYPYLIRMYEPIPIMDRHVPVSSSTEEIHPYRETLNGCFNYMIETLDKVIANPGAPAKIESEAEELGRVTIGVAKALKTKILVTATSPLFNENMDYEVVANNRDVKIFNLAETEEEKKQRWVKIAEACEGAITYLEGLGSGLYYFDNPTVIMTESDKLITSSRGAVTEKWNKEVVWANSQSQVGSGSYDNYQIQAIPRDLVLGGDARNTANKINLGVLPGLTNSFYAKHGVPIEEDKTWGYADRFEVQAPTSVEAEPGYENTIMLNYRTGTVKLSPEREHRYYTSLGSDGGIRFGQGKTELSGSYSVNARKGGNVSPTSADHSQDLTGIWPKKVINYKTVMSDAASGFTSVTYSFPITRMADLYLMYAETLNERGEGYATVLSWIDMVRERSELQGVKESWDQYVGGSKYTIQIGPRQIIMQEHHIELTFEGYYFWDARRRKTATIELTQSLTGWKVRYGETDVDHHNENLVLAWDFIPKMYF